jgi:glycosyltransferase involved in cell wall biosynthesis
MVKFSIVTASFRQLPWLKRCVRSISDQATPHEHIIQDAGTGAELEKWVQEHSHAQLFAEADTGIYDALNRGFARATGEVLAWLNCDEQYLPGTLERVAAAFAHNPSADMVFGDCLVIDARGELVAFRRATPLRPSMILSDHLYDFTCAMFFRRSIFERVKFRTDFRAVGDAEWVSRVLWSCRPRIVYLREYLATFTITGQNLSIRADAAEEARKLAAVTPRWARAAGPLLRQLRHIEKWARGGYRSGPIDYAIYAGEDDEQRTLFTCDRPDFRHRWA